MTGLNNNAYQISRGKKLVAKNGLTDRCDFLKADFMNIPAEEGSYDAVYEIEATCHAPDRPACYSEINRVLKDGGLFGGFEWCMTDKYGMARGRGSVKQRRGDGVPPFVEPGTGVCSTFSRS